MSSAHSFVRSLMTRALRRPPHSVSRNRTLSRPLEYLEARDVPAFTMTVAGLNGNIVGDNANDLLHISVEPGGPSLLVHNRFGIDPGFNSPRDFDSTVLGDQTLQAINSTGLDIDVGGGLDQVRLGGAIIGQPLTNNSPASFINAAVFFLNSTHGQLLIDDGLNLINNTFTVDDALPVRLITGSGIDVELLGTSNGPISLATGSTSDIVRVLNTFFLDPLVLTSTGGADAIVIGNVGSLAGIDARVTAASNGASVLIDGAATPLGDTITVGATGVSGISGGGWTVDTPAPLAVLQVNAGLSGDTINIVDKANFPVTILGGNGSDAFIINGPGLSGTLNLIGGNEGGTVGDTFNLSAPALGATVNIDGNNPIAPTLPGDTLRYNPLGGIPVVGVSTITQPGAGLTNFLNIETLIVINPTTTAVTGSPNPSACGENVRLTATVSSPLATGTVDFFVNGLFVGTRTVVGGVAFIDVATLPVGNNAVFARYNGDANFSSSISPTITQTVTLAGSRTTVFINPSPSLYGELVQVAAVIDSQIPGPVPDRTGTVIFLINGQSTGPIPVNANFAFVDIAPPAGPLNIQAFYSGDSCYIPSSSAASSNVFPAFTQTTVSGFPGNGNCGDTVILVANIADFAGPFAPLPPTGTVTFTMTGLNSTIVGTATVSGNSATLTITSPVVPPDTYAVTAEYSGDNNFLGFTSINTVDVTINRIASSTAVTATPSTSLLGNTVTLRATVSQVSPSSNPVAPPDGPLDFRIGALTIPAFVTNGIATATVSNLPAGTHTVVADYFSGNECFNPSSGTTSFTVVPATSSVSLVAAPSPSTLGQPVTLTATIGSNAGLGAPSTPTGSVQFFIDGTAFGPLVPLAGNVASTTITGAAFGTHAATATFFSTNPSFTNGSGSTAFTVTGAPTSTTVSAVPNPAPFGTAITLTSLVTAIGPGPLPSPNGTVNFLIDGNTFPGTLTPAGPGASIASVTVNSLLVGTYPVVANYIGNPNFLGSTGNTTLDVTPIGTTTSVLVAPASTNYGNTVTLTGTVVPLVGGPFPANPTGTITFTVDGAPVGTAALSGTTASITVPSLLVGTHPVTATYSGDRNFTGGAPGGTGNAVITRAGTTIALSAVLNPATYGDAVTLTATVGTLAGPTALVGPNANVHFTIDGNTFVVPLAGNTATVVVPGLVVGSYPVQARFEGDSNYSASPFANQIVVVNRAATTLSITSSTPVIGNPVTLTATLADAAGPTAPLPPSGTVTFVINGVPQVAALVGNTATATFSGLLAGSFNATASYSGDANFLDSNGTTTGSVSKANTTATLTPSNPTPGFGNAVTFTMTLTNAGGPTAPAPTGSVVFTVDGVPQTRPLVGNSASITLSSLLAGSHTVSSNYTGDLNFNGSTDAETITVTRAGTATNLTGAPATSTFGNPVTLTANVASLAGPTAPVAPTGIVTFSVNGQSFPVTLANNAASTTISTLLPGVYVASASYPGDANFTGGSNTFTITVTRAATTNVLQIQANPITFGQTATLISTVGSLAGSGSTATPTGTVTFTVNGQNYVGTISSPAVVTVPGLPAGTFPVTAVYSGDANFTTSTSNGTLVVNPAATATTFSVPQVPVAPEQPMILNVAVTSGGLPLAPPGVPRTVTINGATLVPVTATLAPNGTATVTIPNPLVGIRTMSVSFPGDANYLGSASSAAQVLVQDDPIVLAGSDFGAVLCVIDYHDNLHHAATAVNPGFTGVRPAAGDFNADGTGDLLVGSAVGDPSLVAIVDGVTRQELLSFSPFGPEFRGGVFVAAGDIDGDGRADAVVSADSSGGSRVTVYLSRGAGLVAAADFLAIDDKNFRGGCRVAVGDMNGDGFADVVASAGPGGAARIAGFNGRDLAQGNVVRMFNDFVGINDPAYRGGAFVALGDITGDGKADLIVGTERGGAPRISLFDGGAILATANTTPFLTFFAGPQADRGGVRVASRDVDLDGRADIIAGSGLGNGSLVTVFKGARAAAGTVEQLFQVDAIPGLRGGIFVG